MINTPFDLRGKTALVTGGSKGIGEAIAHALAQAGADVMISARTQADLEEASARISATSLSKVFFQQTDMTSRDEADALIDAAITQLGPVNTNQCICY